MSTNFAKSLVRKQDYDVTISAHQIQMTTLCHWMKPPHENFLRTPLLLILQFWWLRDLKDTTVNCFYCYLSKEILLQLRFRH